MEHSGNFLVRGSSYSQVDGGVRRPQPIRSVADEGREVFRAVETPLLGYPAVLQQHVFAASGAHAERIPNMLDPPPRRVGRNEKQYASRGTFSFFRVRQHGAVVGRLDHGGERLLAVDAIASLNVPGACRGHPVRGGQAGGLRLREIPKRSACAP